MARGGRVLAAVQHPGWRVSLIRCPTSRSTRSVTALGNLPDRRHLRALPPLLRAAVGARRRTAAKSPRSAAWSHSVLGMINQGAHARGGRDRPRHRVVPQRALARIQDRRRHRAATCSHSFRCSKRRWPRSASSVWPMVEFEADDALAAAARAAARDARVDRVVICTPDKDLAQCVRGTRVVQLNRRTREDPRRSRRRREVRRAAGVDSRLPRARRRRVRRLSRPAGLGREVGRRRARAVRTSRGDSARTGATGTSTPRSRRRWRARSRSSASGRCSFGPGDAADRHPAVRLVDELEWNGPDAGVSAAGRTARRQRRRRGGAFGTGPATDKDECDVKVASTYCRHAEAAAGAVCCI